VNIISEKSILDHIHF